METQEPTHLTFVLTKGSAGKHQPPKLKLPSTEMDVDTLERISRAVKAFNAAWMEEAAEGKKR